jgi:hypothetical protein
VLAGRNRLISTSLAKVMGTHQIATLMGDLIGPASSLVFCRGDLERVLRQLKLELERMPVI